MLAWTSVFVNYSLLPAPQAHCTGGSADLFRMTVAATAPAVADAEMLFDVMTLIVNFYISYLHGLVIDVRCNSKNPSEGFSRREPEKWTELVNLKVTILLYNLRNQILDFDIRAIENQYSRVLFPGLFKGVLLGHLIAFQ